MVGLPGHPRISMHLHSEVDARPCAGHDELGSEQRLAILPHRVCVSVFQKRRFLRANSLFSLSGNCVWLSLIFGKRRRRDQRRLAALSQEAGSGPSRKRPLRVKSEFTSAAPYFVRFASEIGHRGYRTACPLSAISGTSAKFSRRPITSHASQGQCHLGFPSSAS